MKLPTLIAGCVCALASCLSASAQVLMLDFGTTTAADASLTSSPHHSVTAGFTDTIWNKIQVSDISTGLLWSNNTAATGVSINLGATGDATTRTLDLTLTPSGNSALGTVINTGIYAGSSVATDGIFNGATGNTRAVGLQIGGLSAGTYTVYISGRNTNTSATQTLHFFAGTSASSGNFAFASASSLTPASGYSSASITYVNASSGVSAWAEDANYIKLTVNLGAGEYLNLASIGETGELRGFLNAVQIVAIPEPATAVIFAGLAAVAGAVGFRRRR